MSTSNEDLNKGGKPATRKSGIIQGLRSLLGGGTEDSPKEPETPKVEEPKAEEPKEPETPKVEEKKSDEEAPKYRTPSNPGTGRWLRNRLR